MLPPGAAIDFNFLPSSRQIMKSSVTDFLIGTHELIKNGRRLACGLAIETAPSRQMSSH
ncbi:hypothetical protein USDA257_c16620 [Sinorhizobium fredii USDA 257]|uniref:Uncharacterized protein n=1 Tax=Sinorhizobium fredii (strain USDA 257) TaxID=1185652 RepID=I3X2Z5_SINF2|nr:hypothetical protein USDA257_c16620 [Sinorhizobium fredii USDA 257]